MGIKGLFSGFALNAAGPEPEILNSIRDRLVNVGLFATALFSVVVIPITTLRAVDVGWQSFMFLSMGLFVLVALAAVFHRRLSFYTRVFVLLGGWFCMGVGCLLTWGLIGMGIPFLITFGIVAVILLGGRFGTFALGISFVATVVIGLGVWLGVVSFGFDTKVYSVSGYSWLTAIMAVGIFPAIIIAGLGQLYGGLLRSISLLDERSEQLRGVNEQLEAEIAEHERAEEALRISEEKFSKAFRSSPNSIFIADLETRRRIEVNESHVQLTGYSREELLAMPLDAIAIDKEKANKGIQGLLGKGSERNLEIQIRSKTGQIKTVLYSAELIEIRGRKYALITGQDITERKEAEEALRSERDRLQALMDGLDKTGIGVDIVSTDNEVLSQSQTLIERFGDLRGKKCYENYMGLPEPCEDCPMQKAVLSGHVERVELKASDGRDYEILASPLQNPDGTVDKAIEVVQDITYRKRAEEELQKSEERFRDLVESSSDWIWEVDQNGVYTYSSTKVKDILGYEADEINGKTPFDLMEADEAERVNILFHEISSLRRPFESLENTQLHKDGHSVVLETNGVPVFNKEGVFQGYRGVDRDISQRRRADEEREELVRILAMKNEDLESIIYVSSHDLRSPLINIIGFSGELGENCSKFEDVIVCSQLGDESKQELLSMMHGEVSSSLKYISKNVNKLNLLQRGLLRVCRIGREKLVAETLDMNRLLDKVVEGMQYQINSSNASVRVEQLPSCLGNRNQIAEVFTNLIDNAIKYCDPGREAVVNVSGEVEDHMSIYCVEDDGTGIAPEQYGKTFEIFHRLDPEGPVEGEGLGLTIARRIVARHKGNLWLESELGKGSRFYVSLPSG